MVIQVLPMRSDGTGPVKIFVTDGVRHFALEVGELRGVQVRQADYSGWQQFGPSCEQVQQALSEFFGLRLLTAEDVAGQAYDELLSDADERHNLVVPHEWIEEP